MGKLIYKAPLPVPPHEHDTPALRWDTFKDYPPGSIWQCECGKQFRTSARDGYSVWVKHDPNAPTPRRFRTKRVIEKGVYTPQQIRDAKGMQDPNG
jgi:hypothetical protein